MERGADLSAKLNELEREYNAVRSCFLRLREETPEEILKTLCQIEKECERSDLVLERMKSGGRSRGASEIAEAQLEYRCKVKQGLSDLVFGPEKGAVSPDAMFLYAEYAIDLAIYELKQALFASLAARRSEMEMFGKDD
ncbi:MAG: hypothetical protein ACI4PP_00400 [Clostridia bacterium]